MAPGIHAHRKTALVLAGGGLTGVVYEIGALRAIDDLLVDRTVNDFDIYVGTSAGALVSSMLANGLSPQTMLEAIAGDHPDILPLARGELFHFDYGDLWRLGQRIPQRALSAWASYLRRRRNMTVFDLVWSLSQSLPAGLYDNLSVERYVRRALRASGATNEFRKLARELYVIATDLDDGERVVFGGAGQRTVPISLAVAASTALPVLYKPVRVGAHDYVDGGLRGNASLDVAIEQGATLVVCINPLVPIDNRGLRAADRAGAPGHLSERGLTAIASQVGRINSHAGLHYHIKQLRRRHPHVDIILIEPGHDDHRMFFYNIMRYSAQLVVARHGFESVTVQLAEHYAYYKELLARHGIAISRRVVIEEQGELEASRHDPRVVQRVLAVPSASAARRPRRLSSLRHTLAELDLTLDAITPGG